MPTLSQLCQILLDRQGSDLHLTVGSPPQVRIDGRLSRLEGSPLTTTDVQQLVSEMLTGKEQQRREKLTDIDVSLSIQNVGRFRCHVYSQRGSPAAALRVIPTTIQSFEDLGLPSIVRDLVKKPQGLLLITGAAGSGKSTTMATMIDAINANRHAHIVTLEDPIEFLHPHKSGLVNQREIGIDAQDFQTALKGILRQNPDVVCMGDLRDREAVQSALTLAETGHLTLATLPTNSAIHTLTRLVSMHPPHQHPDIRTQLSMVFEGILSQRLVPHVSGRGRMLALEILVPTPAVRNLIRDDKIHQIHSMMQTGQARHGMQTMNQALADLYKCKAISSQVARAHSSNPDELSKLLDRAGRDQRPYASNLTHLRSK